MSVAQRSAQVRGQFRATVNENVPLCREHYRLTLRLAHFPPTEPGQFIQVACNHLPSNSTASPIGSLVLLVMVHLKQRRCCGGHFPWLVEQMGRAGWICI